MDPAGKKPNTLNPDLVRYAAPQTEFSRKKKSAPDRSHALPLDRCVSDADPPRLLRGCWKKLSVACAQEPALLSLRCWTSGGFNHHPSLRLTLESRLELFSITSRNCMNAVAHLISLSGKASAEVALDGWTARGPERYRGESSPFGLSMLPRRTTSVGVHQYASLGS